MRISVIIPIHNLENQILKCLDSIYSQDFNRSEFEILAIFDTCTDNSEAVVREWHDRHLETNIKYISTHCKTPGGARNAGLDYAAGEYIMFIDGDDWLMSHSAMTLLYDAARGHNAVRVMDHGMTEGHVKFSERLTAWLHFFSRELIGSERFTDMLLNEDFEFVKRIRGKAGYNEAIITTPLYFYNYDSERMIERIKNVVRMSRERKTQGLPPLYVDDEFDKNKENVKSIKIKSRSFSGNIQ